MVNRGLVTAHLFAGAGGGLLADLILGHEPLFAVEWDDYCCKVLQERVNDGWFPGMYVHHTDVQLFDPSEYAGRVDCLHAGFPCQDISVAGKQAGLGEGTRSGLYREVLRIADVVRPRELFLENVAAILSNGLGTVLGDLASRGYSARWICLRASDVGANHHRDRWWLLARRGNVGNSDAMWESQPERCERNERGWTCNTSAGSGDVRHPKHNGQSAEPQLRSHETSGDEWRQEEPQPSQQFARTDRPAYVSSIRRCENGSEPSEQYADVADTSSKGFSDGRQPGRCESATETGTRVGSESQRCGEDVADSACRESRQPSEWERREDIGGRSEEVCDVADTNTARLQRLNGGTKRRESSSAQRQPRQCCGDEQRQTQPTLGRMVDELAHRVVQGWWEVEPDVGRVTNVSKDRAAQLKALGNGQVPLQAAVAYSILAKLMGEEVHDLPRLQVGLHRQG